MTKTPEEQPDKLLADALHLLNERPRFTTRDRSLDSYEVAARISRYLGQSRD
jgi:hypothetical protein